MNHLTSQWQSLAAEGLTTDAATFWHVTDDPNFTLDPDYRAQGGESELGETDFRYSIPGLWVTHNPELWKFLWRPMGKILAVEIHCPPGAARRMGMEGDDRDQWFIAKERLTGCTIGRIVPVDVAIKETRKQGQGFALLRASSDDHLIHVADHKGGWGSSKALCGAWCTGEPIKWSTKEWVLREMVSHLNACPECMGKLKRQRS